MAVTLRRTGTLIAAENAYARGVPQDKSKNSAVQSRRPAADVWLAAFRLAGGDPRRLDVLEDGSVLVLNQPKR